MENYDHDFCKYIFYPQSLSLLFLGFKGQWVSFFFFFWSFMFCHASAWMVSLNLLANFLILASLISHVPMNVYTGKLSIQIKQMMLFKEKNTLFYYTPFSILYPHFKMFLGITVVVLKCLYTNFNICDISESMSIDCLFPLWITYSCSLCRTFWVILFESLNFSYLREYWDLFCHRVSIWMGQLYAVKTWF